MSNGRSLHRDHHHVRPAGHESRLRRIWSRWKRWLGVR